MSSRDRRSTILDIAASQLARARQGSPERLVGIDVLQAEIKAWSAELANDHDPPWECPGIPWMMRLQLRLEALFDMHYLPADRSAPALAEYRRLLAGAGEHGVMLAAIDDAAMRDHRFMAKPGEIRALYDARIQSQAATYRVPKNDREQAYASVAAWNRFAKLALGREPSEYQELWRHAQAGTEPAETEPAETEPAETEPAETEPLKTTRHCQCPSRRHGAGCLGVVGPQRVSRILGLAHRLCHSCHDTCRGEVWRPAEAP
jgi:hypothetical protein